MRRSSLVAALVLTTALALPTFSTPTFADPVPPANRVLVIPFAALNLPADKQWISKAVQETLVADLGQSNAYSPVAFSGQVVVEDNATAARLAREASTRYAVRGSAHVVNGDVRLTAQLIDAKTGDTLATGIVTGKTDDLLKLEDDLANQIRVGPAPAGMSTVPVYTTSGTGYVPRSPNAPAAPATTPGYVPPNGNMLQPLNAAVYDDTQQYGVPAYYYSPVYTPSYLDYYPYTYAAPTYAYPYYPLYPVTIFAGFGGFPHFHHGFGSGISFHGSFHGGGFSGSFGHGGHR